MNQFLRITFCLFLFLGLSEIDSFSQRSVQNKGEIRKQQNRSSKKNYKNQITKLQQKEQKELLFAIRYRLAYYKHQKKQARKVGNKKQVKVLKESIRINREMYKNRTTFIQRLFSKKVKYELEE